MAPLVASEVLAETDLDDDQVALLAVEGGRVYRRCVRDSSGVYEVWGCSMSRSEEAVSSLERKYLVRDAGWGCGALQISCCRVLVVSWVHRDVRVSPVFSNTCIWGFCVAAFAGVAVGVRREWLKPIRFGFC